MQRYDWSEYDGMIPMEDGAFVLYDAVEGVVKRAIREAAAPLVEALEVIAGNRAMYADTHAQKTLAEWRASK